MNTFLIIIWHVRLYRVKYFWHFLSKYLLICFSIHQQSNWMHFSTSTGSSFMQESGLSAFHHLNAQISHRSNIPTECKSIFSVSVMSVSLCVCDGRWRRSLQTNRFFYWVLSVRRAGLQSAASSSRTLYSPGNFYLQKAKRWMDASHTWLALIEIMPFIELLYWKCWKLLKMACFESNASVISLQ